MTQQCLPVPGDAIMVLSDDKQLQNSDNLVPAVNADTASDQGVLEALNAVSAQLDTPTLIQLNKAVDIDRKTSAEVAAQFVKDHDLSVSTQRIRRDRRRLGEFLGEHHGCRDLRRRFA